MKHPRFEDLSAFIDGELQDEEMMEVKAHIDVCKECRDRVEFLLALDKGIRETQEKWDVDRFTSEVMERIHPPVGRRNLILKVATIGIAASIIFGFAFTNIRDSYRENLNKEKYQLITQHQIISSGDMGIIFISERK
jgi:predicted anti-sigma-YlaC factor YlaD